MVAPQNLILIDPPSFFEIAGFPWVDGDDDEARRSIEEPNVLLPSRLAKNLKVGRGDPVEIEFGSDTKVFQVAGIYATFGEGPQIGVVANIHDRFFRAGEDRAVVFLAYANDASHERVLSEVEEILAPPQADDESQFVLQPEGFGRTIGAYFVITGAESKEEARVGLSSFIRLFLAVILIAAIVGVLGMANTLTATVLQRFKEIGILQAVGSTPRDVRRMVVVESAVLTFVALIFSIALGFLLAWMFVKGASADIGFDVQLAFPWTLVPVLGLAASLIALLAAAVPARRASKLTPVEALRYE